MFTYTRYRYSGNYYRLYNDPDNSVSLERLKSIWFNMTILQSSPSSISDQISVKYIISEKLQSDGVEQVHVTDVMSAFE